MWIPEENCIEENLSMDDLHILQTEIKKHNLILFVGNGISRLSGARGWEELFKEKKIKTYLKTLGINVERELKSGRSLIELCEIISKDKRLWDHLINQMKEWNNRAKPNIIHKIIKEIEPRTIITTNFDTLLEKAHLNKKKINHLHGNCEVRKTMIFKESDYFENLNKASKTISESVEDTYILFVGYGHSYDDIDVIYALHCLEKGEHIGKTFTIMDFNEFTPIIESRLERFGIQPIVYKLPKNPDMDDRCLALGSVLSELFSDKTASVKNIRMELKKLKNKREEKNKKTSIIVGLASVNRIAFPKPFPVHIRRSFPGTQREREEPGGPALIVSRLLGKLGYPAALVSKIAYDYEGEMIRDELLSKNVVKGEIPVDLDYLECIDPGIEDDKEFWTWRSYVLIHPKKDGQRVILDNRVKDSDNKFVPSEKYKKKLLKDIKYNIPPVIYFDKFNPKILPEILDEINVLPNSKDIWTIYETGTTGDSGRDYKIEKQIINKKVNIVLASYVFARDFLAREILDEKERDNELWKELGGREKNITAKKEIDIIQNLKRNKENLEKFKNALILGAKKWLRDSNPRLIVVTLHGEGCIWIQPDNNIYHVISGKKVDLKEYKRWYTNSSGDVFRGAFIAALLESREKNLQLNNSKVLDGICEIANEIASLKVKVPTVTDMLSDAKTSFNNWKTKLQ